MTNRPSCTDYLASLSRTDLYRWIRLNLSFDQIANVWLTHLDSSMDEVMRDRHLSHCIISLYNRSNDSKNLYKQLAKECKGNYQVLPDRNMFVLDLIEQAKKQKFPILDLSCLSLTSLPDSLFELTHLETLYLAGNLIDTIPDTLFFLKSLVNLDLYKNNLYFLSSKIGQLTQLQVLDLSVNQLTIIPPDITLLTQLQVLDLRSNKLQNIPPGINQLSQLQSLYLYNNQLSSIPSGINQLSRLQSLDLSLNQLNNIPSDIYQLTQLQVLDLSSNRLSNIPSGINQLSRLQSLDLSLNQLNNIPSDIYQLTQLQVLNLRNNNLNSMPFGISQLSRLQSLDLSFNRLSSIPSDIVKLTNLEKLRLQGNDSLPIPPEILALQYEPNKILNYYFQLLNEKEKRQLNEAKMLVVGQGAVGKTSLVNRLVNNTFNESETMTYGISINKWPIQINDERNIQLNIWDFGGQEIMHATHQFFLTKRSLYLLVIDARQGEQDSKIDYWLKTIINFGDDAPIIIVINKIDVQRLELDRKGLKAKYKNIKEFVEVSCKTGKNITVLKEHIADLLSQLPHVDNFLPNAWFIIKTQLEDTKQDYLPYKVYAEMCQKENIDEENEQTLIGFLHDLGVILCFQDNLVLGDTHILNPKWVTGGVYKILNYEGLAIDKGVLKTTHLNRILNHQKYPRDKHNFIVEMMRKFELCFDLDDIDKGTLLIPDLLPKELPEIGDWDDSLKFEYHYDLLPSSVISRFIVRMNAFIYDNTYWRYGVVLQSEDNQNKALVKADLEAKKIFIFVNGRTDSRKDFLSIVRADLLKIHKTIPKLQFEQKIPLPEDPNILLDYEDLLESLEIGNEFTKPKGLKKNILIRPLLEGIERISTMSDPSKTWQEKKLYLEQQLATIADPNQKFALREQIKECEQEIVRLSNQSQPSVFNQSSIKSQNTVTNNNTINEKQPMNKIKILFLTANPDNTTKLRLDQEFRDIKERIKASQYRDCFDIVSQPALRINDLQATLLEHNPHIVHFSGHGNSAGEIILENNQGRSEAVNPTALAELFDILSENIRCVVLNACFSQSQAQAISQHIDSVIGMSTSISDGAAIDFAWAFYQALANGKDINTSFRLGRNQLSFHSIQEKDTPQLLSKPGSDPKSIKLVNP